MRVLPRAARWTASRWLATLRASRFSSRFEAMVRRPDPIIAGPWLGEVGFELLYWVPFLAWCAEHFHVPPERWIVVSRGGTDTWYRSFASRYADVFDQMSPEAFRTHHDERVQTLGEQKQTRPTAFDERLVAAAAARYGVTSWSLLHPSAMYDLFKTYWWGHHPTSWVRHHTRYAELPMPDRIGGPPMPPGYVATKFYFNECFPPTPENRAFASRTLQQLVQDGPVVSLSMGLALDDHEAHLERTPGVQYLPEGIDPARNLHVQDSLVAGARAFVGTYGGFSYLAPFHGVPAYAFYSHAAGFSVKHLDLAREVTTSLGGAPLHVSQTSTSPSLPIGGSRARAR